MRAQNISYLSDLTHLDTNDTFPFRNPLRLRRLYFSSHEPARPGSNPADCDPCHSPDSAYVWVNEFWRLELKADAPLAGTVLLHSRHHYDRMSDLPSEMLSSFGSTAARVEHCLLALGGTERVHIVKSGDGHAHFHVWFYPRPHGMLQLRGALLPVWTLLLRPASREATDTTYEDIKRLLGSVL